MPCLLSLLLSSSLPKIRKVLFVVQKGLLVKEVESPPSMLFLSLDKVPSSGAIARTYCHEDPIHHKVLEIVDRGQKELKKMRRVRRENEEKKMR